MGVSNVPSESRQLTNAGTSTRHGHPSDSLAKVMSGAQDDNTNTDQNGSGECDISFAEQIL